MSPSTDTSAKSAALKLVMCLDEGHLSGTCLRRWVKWLKDCICNHHGHPVIVHLARYIVPCANLWEAETQLSSLSSVVVLFSILLYIDNFGANVSDNTLVSIVLYNQHDTQKAVA